MTKRPILTLKSSKKRKHLSSNDQIKTNNLVEQQQKNIDDKSSQPTEADNLNLELSLFSVYLKDSVNLLT